MDEGSRVKIEELAGRHDGRLRFLGYVPREKTVKLTEKAHIGFLLVRPDARYWVRTSPNKIFEYLVCGTVPIIRADVDHADRLRACSLIFDREDEGAMIVQAVLDLLGSPEKLERYMGNARALGLITPGNLWRAGTSTSIPRYYTRKPLPTTRTHSL